MSDLLDILPNFSTEPYSHLLSSLEYYNISLAELIASKPSDIARYTRLPVSELRNFIDHIITVLHTDVDWNQCKNVFHYPKDHNVTGVTLNDNRSFPDPRYFSAKQPTLVEHPVKTVPHFISCLDSDIDRALGGGFPLGYLSEITGESGAAKTQFLLTLLIAVQLPPPYGVSRGAVYISSESQLCTPRLVQILSEHPLLSNIPKASRPSLQKIHTIQTADLESQEHILRYQLPVIMSRHHIGLIVLDSVAANFRAEVNVKKYARKHNGHTSTLDPNAMSKQRISILQLGFLLQELAHKENVAVIVSNQVSDRFSSNDTDDSLAKSTMESSSSTYIISDTLLNTVKFNPSPREDVAVSPHSNEEPTKPNSSNIASTSNKQVKQQLKFIDPFSNVGQNPFTLDYQLRWFTGWGDLENEFFLFSNCPDDLLSAGTRDDIPSNVVGPALNTPRKFTSTIPVSGNLKTPSLGLVWAHRIAARIALKRCNPRRLRVVFSPWAIQSADKGVAFEVWKGGIRAIHPEMN